MGGIARSRILNLGSARLQRAGRGILPRRTFVLRRPNPGITLIRPHSFRVPRISQDKVELLFEIPIRPNEPIKCFLLPNRALGFFLLIHLARRKGFQGPHKFRQRPVNRVPLSIFFLWPRLKKRVDMVRHHAEREKFVTLVVKMPPCIEDDSSGVRSEFSATASAHRDGINRPWFFEMRETSF